MERANSLQRAHSGLARVPRAGAGGRTSDVLKRLGGALSVEGPGSPLTATVSLPLTSLETEPSEEVQVRRRAQSRIDPPSRDGDFSASVGVWERKRQRDALQEDKARLQSELIDTWGDCQAAEGRVDSRRRSALAIFCTAGLSFDVQELRPQVASLKQQLEEQNPKDCKTGVQCHQTTFLRQALEASEQRASLAERRTEELTEELAHAAAEAAAAAVERLKAALEEQRKLTQEVCEASGRKNEELQQLVERLKLLRLENQQQRCDLQAQQEKHAEMKRNVVVAMAAAETLEKAMQMHQQHSAQLEMLRSAKLAEAINQKVELHIAVPKVTLTYNNAPPLLISVAAALGEDRLQKFLDQEVFPHFEPLWVRLDGLDHAPDGSSKKAYSSRMLDRLTSAVKSFLARSQGAERRWLEPTSLGGAHRTI
ncbi:Hypothetical protein SCF082_LOCUS40290 [Durusdinium trenchii]|uniref:Uncharacterized protein n=1 Tax=Durusdinium trenchii TaxID=1381693 RepID=A0ABP0QAQ0_9DINO